MTVHVLHSTATKVLGTILHGAQASRYRQNSVVSTDVLYSGGADAVDSPVLRRGIHDESLEAHAQDALVICFVVKLPQARFGIWVAQQILGRHH